MAGAGMAMDVGNETVHSPRAYRLMAGLTVGCRMVRDHATADPTIERADVGAVREPGGAPLVFPRAGAVHDSRVNLSCTAS